MDGMVGFRDAAVARGEVEDGAMPFDAQNATERDKVDFRAIRQATQLSKRHGRSECRVAAQFDFYLRCKPA